MSGGRSDEQNHTNLREILALAPRLAKMTTVTALCPGLRLNESFGLSC